MTPKVIDSHAHWYPEEWVRLIEVSGAPHGGRIERFANDDLAVVVPGAKIDFSIDFVDLERRLAAMDRTGVDMHALSLTTPMVDWAPPAFAKSLAETYNDAASAAHRCYPDRFVGLAALPMQDPGLALRELERASGLPGLRGLHLSTHVNGRNLDEKPFFPVFARCASLGWPIFLHPVKPLAHERLSRYHLGNLLGNPFETAVAAASLVFGRVLDELPDLEVVLPHAGGAFPSLVGRLDRGTLVRAELGHMTRPPSAYLRRFSYDTISHNDRILTDLVRAVGADRVLLGSDYCFDMGYERPVEVVERLEILTESDRALVRGGNAARLLRL
jgi:aminocarboxymuconate-semialdehyde decarboxylase